MKDSILLIDDNADLLFNLKILFELNNFIVYTAINGLDALSKLHEDNIFPSLIVCDIMMPKMNGYEFFKTISNDPDLNYIPFIFLTAKSSSEDVRFGKLLGIDDYLTKPFIEEDLLSIVKGKIAKRKKLNEINKEFSPLELARKKMKSPSEKFHSFNNAVIFLILWDEMEGPKLLNSYMESTENSLKTAELEKLGVQLFQSSVSIFGFQDEVAEEESLLLSIKNIDKKGFLLFDYYDDSSVRGGKRVYMLGLINKEISYYDSLIIEKIFFNASDKYKKSKQLDLNNLFNNLFKNGKLIDDEF